MNAYCSLVKSVSLRTLIPSVSGVHEFIRLFMLHVLPSWFHRTRHFGLLASRTKMALARQLLDIPAPEVQETSAKADDESAVFNCRKCQQPLEIMAIQEPIYLPRAPPNAEVK
jgi:hypothetical protein